jgi:CubicO group peptidase (beta-lactamase class C family)
MRPSVLFLLAVACSGPTSGGHAEMKAGASAERARARLHDAVAKGEAPGLQYVVVGPAGVLFDGAAGWADLAGHRPLEPGTTMMAYSMTKTVTAAAVLQLVERGALSLDAPVRTLLPDVPYGDRLTVRHLLAQTSGIPNPIPLRWVHPPEEHATYDERAMLARRLAENPTLLFAPGERYAYSNLSSWLLGRIVEEVSGRPYQAFVREQVFDRLGLPQEEAAFTIPDRARHAKGYLPRWSYMNAARLFLVDGKFTGDYEDGWLHVKDNYLDGAVFGGLVASARAVGRFLQDQVATEPVLLGPEGRRRFFEPQRANDGEPVEMTLGWHVGRGGAFLFKEGGGAGFHAEMRLYPAARLGTVLIANSGAFDVKRFLDAADREFLGAGQPQQR